MLAQAGVLVGFCGGGGTPLYMGNEVEWLTPQSEYRPTEYLQGWLGFWFEDQCRLEAAKQFQQARIAFLQRVWKKDRHLKLEGFDSDDDSIQSALAVFTERTAVADKSADLLLIEAQLTKSLYKYAAKVTDNTSFTRQQVLQAFTDHKALDFMFNTVKDIALQHTETKQVEGESL